jgi:cupin fold WbuC family metalloprotein
MASPVFITGEVFDSLSAEARANPRLRKNLNYHGSEADACHRLLNAIEPESYLPPHRHRDPGKEETLVVLRGALGLLLFDDQGQVTHQVRLAPDGETLGVHLPLDTWHTVVSLQPGTVMIEAKAGPFVPLEPGDLAPWAPRPDAPAEMRRAVLEAWRRRFDRSA